MPRIVSSVLILILFALQSGCLVRPEVLKDSEIQTRIERDIPEMYKGQESFSAPVTLHEATARALRYNLDYRLKIMEEALFRKNFDMATFEMLPGILASAGYYDRNNYSGGSSMSLITGEESLEPSTSQEKVHRTTGISFSWNILDFGISYYKAKQQANQYMISTERRRKVIQNVIQDVRSAYFRAMAAQKMLKRCDDLLARVNTALKSSSDAEAKGLTPPVQALTYQRTLLDTLSLLMQTRRELQLAKIELAALMNVPPGVDFQIANDALPEPLSTPDDMQKMDHIALSNRPELREEDYKGRISTDEAKRIVLGALPGLDLNAAFQYDSNKFLYNQNWFEYSAAASWSITRLLSLPSALKLNSVQADVNRIRRAALTMAIITQVRIAVQRYEMTKLDYELAARSSVIDDKLLSLTSSSAKVGVDNDLEVIRTRTKALLSEIQKYNIYSNVQASYARLLNSLGLDILQPQKELDNVAETAGYMRDNAVAWDRVIEGCTKSRPETEPTQEKR